jgi:hypothetical protein
MDLTDAQWAVLEPISIAASWFVGSIAQRISWGWFTWLPPQSSQGIYEMAWLC